MRQRMIWCVIALLAVTTAGQAYYIYAGQPAAGSQDDAQIFKGAPIPFPFKDFDDALNDGLFGKTFDPLAELRRFEKRLGAEFGEPVVQARAKTTKKEVVVELTIPGLDKDSLSIDVKDSRIRVAYDAKTIQDKKDEKGREYFRSESQRHFEQIIPVPGEADGRESRLVRAGDTVKIIFPKRSALAQESGDQLRS